MFRYVGKLQQCWSSVAPTCGALVRLNMLNMANPKYSLYLPYTVLLIKLYDDYNIEVKACISQRHTRH